VELFADLESAISAEDLGSAQWLLQRLEPAFSSTARYQELDSLHAALRSEKISGLMSQARRAESRGNLLSAAVAFDEVLTLDPTNAVARRGLVRLERQLSSMRLLRAGMAQLDRGDTLAALVTFDSLLTVEPEDSLVRALLTSVSAAPGGTPLSQIQADADAWQLYLKGIEHFRQSKYEKAIELWQRVLEKYPGNLETRKNIEQAKLRLQTDTASDYSATD
jgi:tetratricopeptide (TPR) repeat protein